VNTTQLKRLVFKCKSSINGSLKGLGCGVIVTDPSAGDELLKEIPYWRDNAAEFRRWTIRTNGRTDETDIDDDVTRYAMPEVKPESTVDSAIHSPQFPSSDGCFWDLLVHKCAF
jgi:hypothetical protein